MFKPPYKILNNKMHIKKDIKKIFSNIHLNSMKIKYSINFVKIIKIIKIIFKQFKIQI